MNKDTQILFRTTSERLIRRNYLDYKNGQIHYAHGGKDSVILFIHQSSSSMEEYMALVPYLVDKYQVVLLDLPGHGLSSDPMTEPCVEDFTDAALTVINHLNIIKFSILGHHGGALIAMNFAYQYPERIEKLILSGISGIKSEKEKIAFSINLKTKKKGILDKSGESLLLAWKRYVAYMPDAEINDILRPFFNSVMARIRPYDAHQSILKWNREPALKSLQKPTLLLQGDEDEFVSHQENLLNIIPNAERQVIDGGTFLFFDKAKKCSKIINEFLSVKKA